MDPSSRPPSPGRMRLPRRHVHRQRGAIAIALAIVAVAAAAAALGSFLLQRSQTRQADVQSQWAMLQWADRALRGYVLANKGLAPCPASARNGAQNCQQGSKGWLPVASLLNVAGDPPPVYVNMDVRYLVNRGASGGAVPRDLTVEQAVFVPRLADETPVSGYQSDIKSTMDLCASLRDIRRAQPGGAAPRWRVAPDQSAALDAAVPASAMVYGVAVAAPRAAAAASGINADLQDARLESPKRQVNQMYTDLVRVTQPAALYDAIGCGPSIASLDTMAVAQTWIDVAAGQRAGNIAAGKELGKIVAVATVSDGMYLLTAIGDLLNGVYNIVDNGTKLTAAIASFQFYKIPTYVAGMVIANPGIALSAVDVARVTTALTLDTMITVAYFKLASDAEQQIVWMGGSSWLRAAHQTGIAPVMPAGGAP